MAFDSSLLRYYCITLLLRKTGNEVAWERLYGEVGLSEPAS